MCCFAAAIVLVAVAVTPTFSITVPVTDTITATVTVTVAAAVATVPVAVAVAECLDVMCVQGVVLACNAASSSDGHSHDHPSGVPLLQVAHPQPAALPPP